jgi:hypothetical protein
MQIHELTQPKKSKLDEIEMFGPGGLASEIGSAWKNRKTVYNPAEMAKGLLPTQGGKDARQRLSQAQADADQNELNKRASGAIAQGKQMGLDQKPTLQSAIDKLRSNPVATQWIDGIVDEWPKAAETLRTAPAIPATPATPATAPATAPTIASLGGKRLDPKNPNDAKVLAAMAKQGIKEDTSSSPAMTNIAKSLTTGPVITPNQLPTKIKDWINGQLRTITIDNIETQEKKSGLEALKGVTNRITTGINSMADQSGNIPAQQATLKKILSLVTAANHVIDWERRVSRGTTLADPEYTSRVAQPVNTGLTTAQLQTLGATAARSGDPAPRTTGSNYWDSFIQQAMAAAK